MTSREVFPAAPEYRVAPQRPTWFNEVINRLTELQLRPDGWDSYGAPRLQIDVVRKLVTILYEFEAWIRAAPALSITDSGGVVAEWSSAEGSLEMRIDPDEAVHILHTNSVSGDAWEGPAVQAPAFEKWLWQASADA